MMLMSNKWIIQHGKVNRNKIYIQISLSSFISLIKHSGVIIITESCPMYQSFEKNRLSRCLVQIRVDRCPFRDFYWFINICQKSVKRIWWLDRLKSNMAVTLKYPTNQRRRFIFYVTLDMVDINNQFQIICILIFGFWNKPTSDK